MLTSCRLSCVLLWSAPYLFSKMAEARCMCLRSKLLSTNTATPKHNHTPLTNLHAIWLLPILW